ncbi:MAG: hypothetical protein UX61_C0024G0003 [Parcubacteria group bacterium GW2011_GWA2_46_7]|nr:MAG: hypothetical protein UX15_C0040G0008 [Parcubacteria group bacterium GW2011_GWA1_45_7]KKU10728.1 MAG: hypothetical protein UX14_C0010G0011 [Parcubacteria group bacterium GW2011_GWF1_45_5]KKU43299.1 MAG: hypothetical protein UX61_C0024G0003 [Parcubacteria group bacterium GW2011_GWA2_46_7]KKU46937.1 MAG: hypothetical protein UX66_C0029G0004 [Parcubacteria group bacterium GW2011_GWF2_46_8]OHD12199.1 MAG: hypothetical protein A2Z96_03565 [Spirochaetes bacterium GWB1_48_6]
MKIQTLRTLALQAVAIIRPTVDNIIAQGITEGRSTAWITVAVRWRHAGFGKEDFKKDIVLSVQLCGETDRKKWKHDFRATAESKAFIMWRTGKDGHVVHTDMPTVMETGDTPWHGGCVLGELVIATSGFQEFVDCLVSRLVGTMLNTLAQAKIEATRKANLDTMADI